jgi:hypothetical protein
MGAISELHLFLTLAGVAALLVMAVAWAEGADDPVARSPIYKFNDVPLAHRSDRNAKRAALDLRHQRAARRRRKSQHLKRTHADFNKDPKKSASTTVTRRAR